MEAGLEAATPLAGALCFLNRAPGGGMASLLGSAAGGFWGGRSKGGWGKAQLGLVQQLRNQSLQQHSSQV